MANINADDEMNRDIAKKYDVSSFPTIKFFSADNKDGIAYEGGRSEADLVKYLNEKCNTQRQVGGGLNEKVRFLGCLLTASNVLTMFYSLKAGRLPAFDALAHKFYAAAANSRQTILNEARTLAKIATHGVDHYLKVMEKVVANGDGYVAKEMKRYVSLFH